MVHHINSSSVFIHNRRNRSRRPALGGREKNSRRRTSAGFPSLDCVCANNAPPNKVTCKPGNWRAPATLPKDICEAGTFCDIDCAQGYANFDEAKGCANAGKGYCCKDTKPAKYPFTPNTK